MLLSHDSRAPQRLIERLGRRHFDVRLDAGAFPIRVSDRANRLSNWHTDREMIVDAVHLHGMRSTSRCLSDQGRPLESLQRVAERFGG
jgi:hypothetical protein